MPVSCTTCGLPEALSAKFKFALFAPAVCGENITDTVQLAPLITVPFGIGQGLLPELAMPNSFAFGALIETFVRFNPALPVFVSVTVCAEPEDPTPTVPN